MKIPQEANSELTAYLSHFLRTIREAHLWFIALQTLAYNPEDSSTVYIMLPHNSQFTTAVSSAQSLISHLFNYHAKYITGSFPRSLFMVRFHFQDHDLWCDSFVLLVPTWISWKLGCCCCCRFYVF